VQGDLWGGGVGVETSPRSDEVVVRVELREVEGGVLQGRPGKLSCWWWWWLEDDKGRRKRRGRGREVAGAFGRDVSEVCAEGSEGVKILYSVFLIFFFSFVRLIW